MAIVIGIVALLLMFAMAWAFDEAVEGVFRKVVFAVADRLQLALRKRR